MGKKILHPTENQVSELLVWMNWAVQSAALIYLTDASGKSDTSSRVMCVWRRAK
jgi:hypothetical protein